MTTVLVGVDAEGEFVAALELLAHLGIANVSVKLVHAVNCRSPIPLPDPKSEVAFNRVMENIGLDALDAAMDEAARVKLRGKTAIVFGRAADCWMGKAREDEADVIAVCAKHYGKWSGSYLDSLTSTLAQGSPCSLLVAKEHETHRPVLAGAAVLALDGTMDSLRVVDRFISIQPRGIHTVHVVVAYKIDDDVAAVMEKNPAALGGDVDRWFDEKLEEVCKAATDKLAAGYDATYRVVEAEPNDAIHAEMEATASDLLVIGSSGHIGRVALHQIGYERYPVFMLRTE